MDKKDRLTELKELFKEAANAESFTQLEMAGFMANPILAVTAGVAIGYKLGLCEMNKMLDTLRKN